MMQAMANIFFFFQELGSIVNIIVDYYWGFLGMLYIGVVWVGVDNFMKLFVVEWANCNVCINFVVFGIIKSFGLENYLLEMVAQVSSMILVKWLGKVEEVVEVVLFLLLADYVMGEIFYIDGGFCLWGDMWQV